MKSKLLPNPVSSHEEKYQRTECSADVLLDVEQKILHPLVVDAMRLGWTLVNGGRYAERAGQIEPQKVDINLLFNIKGKERMIAGMLDHNNGHCAEKIEGLRQALAPYIQPTVNNYSYESVPPEKMGVYINQKEIERNKAVILLEAEFPGCRDKYCAQLKETLMGLDFEERLTHLQKKACKALKRYLIASSDAAFFLSEIARADANFHTCNPSSGEITQPVEKVVSMIKGLILYKPYLVILLVTPSKWAGLVKNKGYWRNHPDDTPSVLGYIQREWESINLKK